MNIRYVHTNLIAKDWRKLADFYIKVLGCKEKKPERNLNHCGEKTGKEITNG